MMHIACFFAIFERLLMSAALLTTFCAVPSAGEDRVLVKREERLERCAPERVELHPELFEEFYGDARD